MHGGCWQSEMAQRPRATYIPNFGRYTIYISEPDMTNRATREEFLAGVMAAFGSLKSQAGYYDLPDVRDLVCQNLLIPEAAFDKGINALLDMKQPPVTLGLTYNRITGRRKPLVSDAREYTDLQPDHEVLMPINLPKKSTTEIASIYTLLGLTDMPFPSNGFVNPHSPDPKINGAIYAVSTAKETIAKFESLLIRPDDFLNRAQLAYLWAKGDSENWPRRR